MGTWSFHPMGNDDALNAQDEWFSSFPQIQEWIEDDSFYNDNDKVRKFLEQLTSDEIKNAIEKTSYCFYADDGMFYGYVIPYTYLEYSAFDLSDEVKETLKELLDKSINVYLESVNLSDPISRDIALHLRVTDSDPDYFPHHLMLFEKYFDEVISGQQKLEECRGLLDVMSASDPADFEIEDGVLTLYFGSKGDVVIPNVVIPNGVTSVGEFAFANHSELTSVTIPDSVTEIREGAFDSCERLTSVTIPESVTFIGKHAFSGCFALTSITIPAGVTEIVDTPFDYSGLTSIEVDAGNPTYRSENNCLIEKTTGTLVTGCVTSVIPTDGSVTSIGEFAFAGCDCTSITIPDSVTRIGEGAFDGTGLTSVTIPVSLTRIGKGAFAGCSGLTSVTIPNSVTEIEKRAFAGCSGLTSIIFQGTREQWKNVNKGDDWDVKTGDYVIHCSDGDVAKNK